MDNDGFQIVTRKGKHLRNKPSAVPNNNANPKVTEHILIDTEKVKRRIEKAIEDLRISKYFEEFVKSVSTLLQSSNFVETICFGLGHFSECNISIYQLALLLCTKHTFELGKVLVHDPVFYKQECEILKQFGLEVIQDNQEGCYVISDQGVSLVYFPHCPKQLTNNFLWSNWGPNLSNCILICNSFTTLLDNQPTRILMESVPYICKVFPYVSEVSLDNNFTYTDIFNDTSIHQFPKRKLELADLNFWARNDKPSYEHTEEFITSLMIKKLTI